MRMNDGSHLRPLIEQRSVNRCLHWCAPCPVAVDEMTRRIDTSNVGEIGETHSPLARATTANHVTTVAHPCGDVTQHTVHESSVTEDSTRGCHRRHEFLVVAINDVSAHSNHHLIE
jgi:hypothetical protein